MEFWITISMAWRIWSIIKGNGLIFIAEKKRAAYHENVDFSGPHGTLGEEWMDFSIQLDCFTSSAMTSYPAWGCNRIYQRLRDHYLFLKREFFRNNFENRLQFSDLTQTKTSYLGPTPILTRSSDPPVGGCHGFCSRYALCKNTCQLSPRSLIEC